ncbi:MAG TPA: hypothetical protein VGD56_10355 [Gemmatirosa sp.]
MANTDQPTSGSRPAGGPDANDPAYKQLESQRHALHAQADVQATAETEDPHRAVADRTGTALRAESAAGDDAVDANARDDADRAFQASRGDHQPRDRPTSRS